MSISSDGQLCYGIAFEIDYEFPWLNEKWEGELEDWWFKGICKYKPLFEIWNNQGEYIDGIKPSEQKIKKYYKNYNKFKKDNPMPVDVVQHCSYNYPMYIIAVPGTYQNNCRGDVTEIKIRDISKKEEQNVIDFCEKYCKNEYDKFPKMELKWLLTSMYG